MTDILSERDADKQVIKNLLRELKKRGYMGKILVDPTSGEIYNAVQFELLSEEDLKKNIEESKGVIDDINTAIQYAKTVNQPTPAAPAVAPVEAEQQPTQQLAPPEATATAAPVLQ